MIESVVADAFETKCRLVGSNRSSSCVVVDPGLGIMERLPDVLAVHRRTVAGVLLTHGHLDHTFAVTDICDAYDVPCYVHPGDLPMLDDPMPWLGAEFGPQFDAVLPVNWRWRRPTNVVEVAEGDELALADLLFSVHHTPGHTPGSVMYGFSGEDVRYRLVGDVLYAGTIGRTDMPGGDRAQTLASLRRLLEEPDDLVLLTGHFADTTVGAERDNNPFMVQAGSVNAEVRG
ncbi:MBL fold metallo-hydrolase [Oerskovia jenensis]|uniref:MBL fold metallo-hydrolase n=1 Tax=Oerskovia jenensis TaxID=162169 RepID=UPI001EF77F32